MNESSADDLPLEQWYELGPPGLVYSGTLLIGWPCHIS